MEIKKYFLVLLILITSIHSFGQKPVSGIVLTTDETVNDSDIRRLLAFEGIEFLKIRYNGDELINKSYRITVKEIWNGKIKSESDLINSADFPVRNIKRINDTIFTIDIISKLTSNNKLKMRFAFPGVTVERQFDAVNSENYSLRNMVEGKHSKIEPGKKFYFLTYMLPYKKDEVLYWCTVLNSETEIENWGKEYDIEHYLVFEMIFEAEDTNWT
ncbi:hypothetical protein [Natronoflexus pectinivorans]|nr:hypothetical protein [Natronoflexus pectinivorans]